MKTIVLQRTQYDIFSAGDLSDELAELDGDQPCIDLSNVRRLDACSLGQFVHTLKRVRRGDDSRTIRLVNVGTDIRRILKLTKLDDLFDVA